MPPSASGCGVAALLLLLTLLVIFRHSVSPARFSPVEKFSGSEIEELYVRILGRLLMLTDRSGVGPWTWAKLEDFAPLRERWYREEEQRLEEFDDQIYTGESCLLPLTSWPVPERPGPWKQGCFMPQNGTFRTKPGHKGRTHQNEKLCSETQLAHGSYERTLWKPYDCEVRRLTRTETWRYLRGKNVLVYGDSMMRNVFWRFVSMMRGMVAVSSPKTHVSPVYWMTETADYLQWDGPLQLPRVAADGAEVRFLWAVHGLNDSTLAPEYDILIGSYIYHDHDRLEQDVKHQEFLENVLAPHQVLVWVNTPRKADPGVNGFLGRNQRWREWIEAKRRTEPGRYHYIDFAALHDNHTRWQKDVMNGPGWHFQCGLIPAYTVTGDCRDMMNINLWYLILHVLCTNR